MCKGCELWYLQVYRIIFGPSATFLMGMRSK